MKKILIFFILFLLIINLFFINTISFVSADKVSGSFTITGEVVEEANDENDSFLNSIKNFFIYAFTLGGEFEIFPQSTGEEVGERGGSSEGSAIEPIQLENKSDSKDKEDLENYNQTNKTIGEETSKETETPWKIKRSQTIFIIILILIVITLLLLKRKITKLFKGRAKKK